MKIPGLFMLICTTIFLTMPWKLNYDAIWDLFPLQLWFLSFNEDSEVLIKDRKHKKVREIFSKYSNINMINIPGGPGSRLEAPGRWLPAGSPSPLIGSARWRRSEMSPGPPARFPCGRPPRAPTDPARPWTGTFTTATGPSPPPRQSGRPMMLR